MHKPSLAGKRHSILDLLTEAIKRCLSTVHRKGRSRFSGRSIPKNPCHTYLLHPPGGVVGGDTLQIRAIAERGAQVLITTPGATKFYRSETKYAKQRQILKVEKDSRLEWLPQENIFFPDAHVRMDTEVHLETGAQFLGWEMHCFGRPALNEGFSSGHLVGKTEIYLDGKRLLTEGLNVKGEDNLLKNKGLLDYQMMGTLYISIDDEDFSQLVQSLLTNMQQDNKKGAVVIAASQLENLLVIRALGNWSEVILDCFQQVWQAAREHWTGECPYPPRFGQPEPTNRIDNKAYQWN